MYSNNGRNESIFFVVFVKQEAPAEIIKCALCLAGDPKEGTLQDHEFKFQ